MQSDSHKFAREQKILTYWDIMVYRLLGLVAAVTPDTLRGINSFPDRNSSKYNC